MEENDVRDDVGVDYVLAILILRSIFQYCRKRKISALEEIKMVSQALVYLQCRIDSAVMEFVYHVHCCCFQMEEQRKEKMNRRDNWLAEVRPACRTSLLTP